MARKKNAPARPVAPSLARALEQAILAHQQGQWGEAIPHYLQVLAHQPYHLAALTNLASLYTRQTNYPEALACYKKALQSGKVAPELWFNYGNLQQKLGMTDGAIASFKAALRLQPQLYPAHYNLANLYRDQGETEKAIEHYRSAIRLHPGFLMAYRNLGNLFRQSGQTEAAIQQHQRALALPEQTGLQRAESHYNLANALAEANQTEAAIQHYQAALALAPDMVAAWLNLGNLKQQAGDEPEAEACYRAAMRWAPDGSGYPNLIRLYQAQGREGEAEALLAEGLARAPEQCELLRLEGDRLYKQEDPAAALAIYQRMESLQPGLASVANALGVAYRAVGQTAAAEEAWQRCLTIDPRHVVALTNLGTLYRLKKRHEEALAALRLAVSIEPNDGDSVASLACTLIDVGAITTALQTIEPVLSAQPEHVDLLGMKAFALVQQARIEEAQALLAKARQLKPDSPVAIGNTLFSSLYRDQWDGVTQTRFHQALSEQISQYAKPLCPPRATISHHASRRRIGYISPDFRTHPVGLFIEPVLKHHRADQFHITCYALPHAPDETTQRLMGYAHQWRDFEGWSLARMAAQIQEDEIDILVDLAGYTAGGRMDLMACRPAPIQVIFIGYPYTTGLATMDYILADAHLIPPHHAHLYTERVARFKESFLCYQRQGAPDVAPLPARRNGFITFGSYNNLPKISGACLDLWARVLQAVPHARLALKASSLGDEGTCQLFRQHFSARQIDPSRILLMSASSPDQYLAAFGLLDIALDPIPFNGGTTSCDTCWMGVPLVTMVGETFMGRMGTSLLTTIGHPEWIATSADEYVQIAAGLASDLTRLAHIRLHLRPTMQASGLCDAAGYTAHLEQLYREMRSA